MAKTLMRAGLVSALVVGMTTGVLAQVSAINLMTLGLGPLEQPVMIEVDGNAATQEYLVTTLFTTTRRVVRVSSTGLMCVGNAFTDLDGGWTKQIASNGRHYYTKLVFPDWFIYNLAQHLPAGCGN